MSLQVGNDNDNGATDTMQAGCRNNNSAADVVQAGSDNNNTGSDTVQSGTGNTNSGTNAIQGGNKNTNTGTCVLQVGDQNYNGAGYSLQSGVLNQNYGSDSVMFGHTQTNRGQHSYLHGYENYNITVVGKDKNGKDVYADYVDIHGTRLKATRRCQMLRGQWSKDDKRALAIWANGTSETDRKNVFTVAASGTPEVDTDGVPFGYLLNTFKAQLMKEILDAVDNRVKLSTPYVDGYLSETVLRCGGGWAGQDKEVVADVYRVYVNSVYQYDYTLTKGGNDEDIDISNFIYRYTHFTLGLVAHKVGYADSDMCTFEV
jgi:hypothetical protein